MQLNDNKAWSWRSRDASMQEPKSMSGEDPSGLAPGPSLTGHGARAGKVARYV